MLRTADVVILVIIAVMSIVTIVPATANLLLRHNPANAHKDDAACDKDDEHRPTLRYL